MARYKVGHDKALRELSLYLASNIGKDVSYNALKKMLGLGSATTVSEYCDYLSNSFLDFFINRYNYSLKKQIQYSKKSYFIDAGIAKAIGFRFSEDYGRMLENAVFLELKRRGQGEIYFHREQAECDFILREGTTVTTAIQVTQHVHDQNRAREMQGLIDAAKQYSLEEAYLLTEDQEGTEKLDNSLTVKIVPVWKWLLSRE